jgi:hypothetical protein
MRSVLIFGGLAALGLIVVAIMFQFSLGPIFTYAMIAFACCYTADRVESCRRSDPQWPPDV